MPGSHPKRLGRYRIDREVGQGGMGIVYKGYDPSLDREVAIKQLPPTLALDGVLVKRFLREASIAAQLRHPNIIEIYEVVERDKKRYYFVMPYLPGPSLKQLVCQRGRLTPLETISILRQLANALDYAHSQGLIHRDVKPDNIIFDEHGWAALTDFGLVKAAEGTTLTKTGAVIGTPSYMAPEQIEGKEVDARTDQYSLGITAFEMLTGQVPFSAKYMTAIFYQQIHEPPLSIHALCPELPPSAEDVLNRALAKAPVDRYGSCGEFVQALEQALSRHTVAISPRNGVEQIVQLACLSVRAFPYIRRIQWSSDNERLAVLSSHGIYFYDVQVLQQIQTVVTDKNLWGVAVTGDGNLMAQLSINGTVVLRETADGHEIHTFTRHAGAMGGVSFSPDETLLMSWAMDGRVKIKLWKVSSKDKVCYFSSGHGPLLLNVVFSPDGRMLASGGFEEWKLWDAHSGRKLRAFSTSGLLTGMTFSPDGRVLASKTVKNKVGNVLLWDIESGSASLALSHDVNDISLWNHALAFSPDGMLLAVGFDEKILLWDVQNNRELGILSEGTSLVNHLAFSPDGTLLVSASKDGVVRLWGVR